MKKLLIYSSIDSPHTMGLFAHLSKTWDTDLLYPATTQKASIKIIEKYKKISEKSQIKSDIEFIKSTANFLLGHPFRSLGFLKKGIDYFKMMIYFSRKSKSIKKTIAEIKPNLLYVHQLYLGLIAYFTGFKPYIITFWGSDLYRDIKQFKNKQLIIEMLNSAALIHVVNEEHKELLINEYSVPKSNIFIQNFGADIDKFLPIINKKEIKEKLDFKEEYIILSARYAPDANLFRLDIIAKAFKKLLDKYPELDARLIFANRADLDMNLRNLVNELGIQDKVTFTGFLEGEKYQEIVKISDIFIQCPYYDSVGIALMEAMAAGVPVISTEVDGAKMNLKNGYNGFFIEKRDPKLIMEKLSEILFDDTLRKNLGKNASEWVSKNCDRKIAMENISNKLLQAITKP